MTNSKRQEELNTTYSERLQRDSGDYSKVT